MSYRQLLKLEIFGTRNANATKKGSFKIILLPQLKYRDVPVDHQLRYQYLKTTKKTILFQPINEDKKENNDVNIETSDEDIETK